MQSLKYAFLVDYSTKWYGNPELRETLIAFALKASSKNLEYLINEVRNIIKEVSKIPPNMQSPSYEKIKKSWKVLLLDNQDVRIHRRSKWC